MAQGLSGQEFGPKCNVAVFAQKILGIIYKGPRNKQKILWKQKN